MAVSPSISNYYIGKGNVYMKATADADVFPDNYVHVGNCPKFSVTPQNTVKEHQSVIDGVGVVDFVSVTQKAVDVTISAEEFTNENLTIALGATVPGVVRNGYAERSVRFYGSNTIGQEVQIYLPHVLFIIDSEIDLITDDWGVLELTGKAVYSAAIAGFMAVSTT